MLLVLILGNWAFKTVWTAFQTTDLKPELACKPSAFFSMSTLMSAASSAAVHVADVFSLSAMIDKAVWKRKRSYIAPVENVERRCDDRSPC